MYTYARHHHRHRLAVQCDADPSLPSPQVSGPPQAEQSLADKLTTDECRFTALQAQETFNVGGFMGTWYHMYR